MQVAFHQVMTELVCGKKCCAQCNAWKSPDDFYFRNKRSSALQTHCKACMRKRARENYHKRMSDPLVEKEFRKRSAEYGHANKEARAQARRLRRIRHPEKIRQRDRERYHKYKKNIQFRLAMNLRSRLRSALKGSFKGGSAVRNLGCSIDQLKHWLEGQFAFGMSWDNYGDWHIDHIIPLSRFDLTNHEEVKVACHYTNLQPLWAEHNLKKGDSL